MDEDKVNSPAQQDIGRIANVPINIKEIALTADEEAKIAEINNSLDFSDSSAILAFGSDAQKKLSAFTDRALRYAGAADLESAEELIKSVVSELEGLSTESKPSFFGKGKALQKMRDGFQKTLSNIEKISRTLEGHRIQLLSDINMCEELYTLSEQNVRELTIYILAGKRKLKDVENELMQLSRDGTDNPTVPQNFESAVGRFDKRVHDLDIARISAYQFCAQVCLLRENLMSMSDQIRSTLVSVIPIWKSRMMLAMGMSNLAEAANTQREAKELTDHILRQSEKDINALSKQMKGDIDMEAVAALNTNLIEAVTKTVEINKKIRDERKEADSTLQALERDLKNRLGEFY